MLVSAPNVVAAQDQFYPKALLEKEKARLSRAVEKIVEIGLKPKLTPTERAALGDISYEFPMPRPGDSPLNFYATFRQGRSVVTAPLVSLKQVEDLATAYAWLYHNGYSLSTIDLYFAMARRQPKAQFANGRPRTLLQALGVPKTALAEPKVDALSLALRNEAYAFIIAHELGHIRFAHKGYGQITKARARADEVQSDSFALDLLGRSATPPMGAVLFFQAQAHLMPHRGEFASEHDWQVYLRKASTHPLSVDRIDAMANYIAGPLARRRPLETALWSSVAKNLHRVTRILQDVALQRCIARVALNASLDALKPRRGVAAGLMARHCR